ncbi:SsgA family sporulation/cell division regulator [Amycolatopsis sp. NPDC004079]|uniref:SsgA family sporulation/cell division regulator n=1 Tax=Amycolatopsis sp. NPDC004079 TaxID=3154549 RepID=UPI0033B56EDA
MKEETTLAAHKTGTVDVPVRVRLTFDPKDPFAVTFAFRNGRRGEVPWMFGRELLFDGLASPTPVGDGDVRLTRISQDTLQMEISSPSGSAQFEFDVEPVADFLAAASAEAAEIMNSDLACDELFPARGADRGDVGSG